MADVSNLTPLKADSHKIEDGCIEVYVTLPSGKKASNVFILQNLLQKVTSIFDCEFLFEDENGVVYGFIL